MKKKGKILTAVLLVAVIIAGTVGALLFVKPAINLATIKNNIEGESPVAEYSDLMPDTDEIYGWANQLVNMGARKPGTDAWKQANSFVTEKFNEFGLSDIKTVNSKTTLWQCDEWSLNVGGEEISSYYMTHTFHIGNMGAFSTPEGGLNTEIVYVGDGSESDFKNADVEGKIVVANVKFTNIPITLAKAVTSLYYDPDGEVGFGDAITNPYSANTYPYNYYRAMENGAVGFVGVLVDYYESNEFNNEDYSYMGGKMKIPGLWVTKNDGEKLAEMIENGNNKAVLNMSGSITEVDAGAVVGLLPGQSDEIIMVQSHYDSSTPGGAEDASGTSVVLAMADFFSQIPENEREKSILFVLMDSHFNDYESHDYFIAEYLQDGHKILADVCIEHIAMEYKNIDGELVATGEIEPRIVFTSGSDMITDITNEEIVRHGYAKTAVIPAAIFDEPPTDADMYYQLDVPIVSLISGPLYLYDNCDTADKIAKDQLKPTAETFSAITLRLMDLPADEFKD